MSICHLFKPATNLKTLKETQTILLSVFLLTGHGSNRKIEGSALSNLNIIGEENDIIHNTTASQGNPLFFFYDSEATGGSVYTEHIIEMAAVVSVPEGVSVTKSAMSSLLGTSKGINSRGISIKMKIVPVTNNYNQVKLENITRYQNEFDWKELFAFSSLI